MPKKFSLSLLFSQIFSSDAKITNQIKYRILQCACAMVHLMLIIIFAVCGVYPLVVFNIASTVCYILCGRLVKNEKYITMYYITFAEICLHSYVAAILVGWGAGFPLYILGIMPVIFYMHFSLTETSDLRETLQIGISAFLIFLTCKLITVNIEPIYELSSLAENFMYIFNTMCTFLMLLFFSLLFLKEIKSSHTELEKQNAWLDKMAGVDALTGLYNRRSMKKFINSAASSDMPFSFIMCDIDNFKKINDTYGHQFGDIVLKSISDVILASLRENDFVCRWGGEEILILANETKLETAAAIANRIRRKVERLEIINGAETISCTLTMGVAENSEKETAEEVITLADDRLYVGKTTGKNRVISE